jgi:hypothetical protein
MADHRRQYDEGPRRHDHPNAQSSRVAGPGHERDWSDRAGDDVRSWFGDDRARQRRGNDERDDRFPYGGVREDRASRWEGPRDDREYSGYYATGSYRTDDRGYHDRYRHREDAYPYRDREYSRHEPISPRHSQDEAADEYYRAAREQREDFLRYEAHSPGAEFEHREPAGRQPWPRERGGYWRQYEAQRAPYAGRGPKDYKRSDDRVREEVCDCMTDDPLLDASDIVVQVSSGEVTLSGTVSSRDQKRRAEDVAERISGVKDVTNQLRVSREGNGHAHTASQPVSQAYGTETPSKSTSGTSA